MYTGMRIDEICSLRAEDVVDEHGIPCLQITSGKTHAAVRLVPVHSALKPLIDALKEEANKKGRDGYLLSGLVPGGPGAKRSWNIQKAFGRRKAALGFPKEQVFHSLRGTFITKLKRAGAPVMLVKEIVGHHVNDLTFGQYSDEHLTETKRDAIELVRYEV